MYELCVHKSETHREDHYRHRQKLAAVQYHRITGGGYIVGTNCVRTVGSNCVHTRIASSDNMVASIRYFMPLYASEGYIVGSDCVRASHAWSLLPMFVRY